jgi:hypothetical protein
MIVGVALPGMPQPVTVNELKRNEIVLAGFTFFDTTDRPAGNLDEKTSLAGSGKPSAKANDIFSF